MRTKIAFDDITPERFEQLTAPEEEKNGMKWKRIHFNSSGYCYPEQSTLEVIYFLRIKKTES